MQKNNTSNDHQIKIVTITPERAAIMLESNRHNRPVSQSRVAKYASDMKAGNWKFTHQGLAFDSEGHLIDGQHRLLAVINSGISLPWYIFGGFDSGIFDVLDTGGNRSRSDVLGISGLQPRIARIISAAIPYCLSYDEGYAPSKTIQRKYGNTNSVTLKYYNSNPAIEDSAVFVSKMPRRDSILRESLSCFFHFEISKKYQDADVFLSQLLTGDGVNSGTVIAEMRKQLFASRIGNFRLIESTIINRVFATYNYFHRNASLTDWKHALHRVQSDVSVRIS